MWRRKRIRIGYRTFFLLDPRQLETGYELYIKMIKWGTISHIPADRTFQAMCLVPAFIVQVAAQTKNLEVPAGFGRIGPLENRIRVYIAVKVQYFSNVMCT